MLKILQVAPICIHSLHDMMIYLLFPAVMYKYIYILAHIYLDVCCWPVSIEDPC